MRGKNLQDLQLERDVFNDVKSMVNHNVSLGIAPKASSPEMDKFLSKFSISKEDASKDEVRYRYFDAFNELNAFKKEFTKISAQISMFKALKLEHDKLNMDTQVSNTLKEASRQNLVYYEKSILDLGVSPEIINRCLEEPKYETFLIQYYGDEFANKLEALATKNGTTLSDSKDRIAKDLSSEFYKEIGVYPHLMSKNKDEVAGFIKIPQTKFFGRVLEAKYDLYERNKETELEFYKLENGEYVEKEAPTGFFSNLFYRIRRYFSDERKMVNEEKKALEELKKNNDGKDLEVEKFQKEEEVNKIEEKEAPKAIDKELENNNLLNKLDVDANLEGQEIENSNNIVESQEPLKQEDIEENLQDINK